ncbi:MAG: quinohemoprotein amine dehydrogenase subunit gamma [Acidobacteria bacterium]|nr:quinohemoprotein amine dehydrogenase subunit gamma [Acidobacteriota bacterium]
MTSLPSTPRSNRRGRTSRWDAPPCSHPVGSGPHGRHRRLCQPVERDLFDCHLGCFWPAQVPDQLNRAPDWTKSAPPPRKTGARST